MHLKHGILLLLVMVATSASAITLPVAQDTTWVNSKVSDSSVKAEAALGKARHVDCIGVRRGTPMTNLANGIWSAPLLQFNYGALPASTTTADVVKATLWIMPSKVTYPGYVGVCAFTGTSWNENGVSYDTPFSYSDPEGSFWVDTTSVGQWQVVDVTQLVQDWVGGAQANYGFTLVPTTGTSGTTGSSVVSVQFASREAGYDYAYLEVVLAGDGAQGPQGAAGTPANNSLIESTLAEDQTFVSNVGAILGQNTTLESYAANALLGSATFQTSLVTNLTNNGAFVQAVKGVATIDMPTLETQLTEMPTFIAEVGTQASGTVSAALESSTAFALNLSNNLAANSAFQYNLVNALASNTTFIAAARGPQGPAGSAAPSPSQVATGNYGAINLSFTAFPYNVQTAVQSTCSDGAGTVWAVCQEVDSSYSIRKFQGSQELKSGTGAWISGLRVTGPIYCTGDKIWAAEFIDDAGTGALFVYDATTGAQLQNSPLPSAVATRAAQRMAFNGQIIAVLTHGTVTDFNASSLAVSGSFSTLGFDSTLPTAYAADMTSDGTYLWIGCGSATFKTDNLGNVLARYYPFGGQNMTFAANSMWCTTGVAGTVLESSLDGSSCQTISPFNGGGITGALVYDGTTLWIYDSEGIVQINPVDNSVVNTILPTTAAIAPPFTFDGQHVWAMVNGGLTRL